MDIKERIIVACRDLSSLQGFHNVNMDELAAQAGISKRTLYRHFPSKEAVIEATLDSFMAQVADEVERILQSEPEPAHILSGLMQYLFIHGKFIINPQSFTDLKQHYPRLWQKIDQFRMNRIKAILAFINSNGEAALDPEIDPRIITAVILASIQAVLNPDFVLTNNLTFEETARQLSKLLMITFIPR
jgi:AcrR family transcriptional regulator